MIGLLLEKTRDHLITTLSLDRSRCDIAPEGHPPSEAAKEFLAIDEGGSSNASPEMLSETVDIIVSICRQPGAWPTRKRGEMLQADDPYLADLVTMTSRARQVIKAIHANWSIIDAVNTAIGVPDATTGDHVVGALFYVSQSRQRVIESESGALWVSRDVVFRGAWRPQPLTLMG